jgi:serine/threonine protein kinase
LTDEPLVISDALLDPRFADNPLVTGDPTIRFYAGIPLVLADGVAVGSLCVIDRVPRELSPAQLDALERLARQVVNELSLRRKLAAVQVRPVDGAPLPAAVQRGTLAGRYRIGDIIATGGMGVVVAATDSVDGRDVAIKFILPEALGNRAIERFVREAQALLRVAGDHVTRVLDAGNLANGAPYIVMERLFGEDLDTILNQRGALPIAEAVAFVVQACAGLASVHAAGILHRDIKPANLFISDPAGPRPVLKLLDFGISSLIQRVDASDVLTGEDLLGSPHYMSPEQMTRDADLDPRTDVWSLGVVLYELLMYRRPFEGGSTADICGHVLQSAPRGLCKRRSEVPAALEQVVLRCLAKNRRERYPGPAALADALAPFVAPPRR